MDESIPRILLIAATLLALLLTRGLAGKPASSGEAVPALGFAPALKLRIFYAGLLLTEVVSLWPRTGDAPFYLLLLILFASVPTLGHQTIGLTPARRQSTVLRRLWLLGLAFPVLVLAFGIELLADRVR